jgi:4-amino-4-deoxy-L-arabinose transferase-like glycosyltransferase
MIRVWRFKLNLKSVLLCCGAIYIAIYILTAILRMAYPYELEAMEGGMVDHVLQILAGEKLYVPPSLNFVPYAYPPFYFYLAAAFSKLLGVGFFPLRLISFCASLGIMALIYLFVRKETNDRSWAVVAAALFAATYRLSDAWFDLARIDSLFILFMLLFAYLVRFHPSRMLYASAAVVLLLAALTKQSALMIALPLVAYAVFFEKRSWPWLLGTSTALIGGGIWILNAIHRGWYMYYIFDLTGQRWLEKLIKQRIIGFWTDDMLKPLAVTLFLLLGFLLSEFFAEEKKRFFFYFAFAGAMIGTAWFSRLEYGAYGNALLSAHAYLAIGFGLALAKFWQGPDSQKSGKVPVQNIFLFVLALIQFVVLAYNPFLLVPNAADRKAGDHLIKTISMLPGDVMIPGHGFLSHLAGKPRTAQEVALKNLIKIDQGPVKVKLEKEIAAALESKRFAALILDTHNWFRPILIRNYEFSRIIFPDQKLFWPVTGKKLRPNFIYIAKKPL